MTDMVTLPQVVAFLCGEAPLDGVWFGERHPTERGAFWWREHLRAALAQARQGEAVARVEETCSGPRLLVYGVQAQSWLSTFYNQDAHRLAAEINAAAPPPAPAVPEGWVACSERMPEDSSEVIASWPDTDSPYDGCACVGTAAWTGCMWVCAASGEELRQDVTHWMPLPAAPSAPPPPQQGE